MSSQCPLTVWTSDRLGSIVSPMTEDGVVATTAGLAEVRRMSQDGRGRRIRRAPGVSAADIAAELGVRETTVLRWEKGQAFPRRPVALRYRAILVALAEVAGDDL